MLGDQTGCPALLKLWLVHTNPASLNSVRTCDEKQVTVIMPGMVSAAGITREENLRLCSDEVPARQRVSVL